MTATDPARIAESLAWVEGPASPTGRRVLDVRPAARTLLSASADPNAARTVLEAPADPAALASGRPSPAEQATTTAIDWAFDDEDLQRLREGFAPSAMEDKWRIVAREAEGRLEVFFRRSWTNDLVFVLEVEDGRGRRLAHRRDAFAPELTLRAVLDGYLLARPCVVHAPRALGTDKLRLMSYGISLAGRRADYVEPEAARDDARSPHPLPSVDRRRRGAMLGLAIGDALGAAVEFKPRGTFAPVTDFRAGGPHGLAPGEWTDDTSMALALADSLALHGFDLEDQARRYLAWWRQGRYSVTGRCFDIGSATSEALARIEVGAAAAHAGDEADAKSGNGSIMRLAPIAVHYLELFPSDLPRFLQYADASSRTTHRSAKCLSACRYLAAVLAALIGGRDREEVLSPDWPILEELHRIAPLDPAILEVARGSHRQKSAAELRGGGYVVDSLEAALWAFERASSFDEAVLAAVNLGDDADTTGAVTGQLAGAFFGLDGIPSRWLDGLARREWIEEATARLAMPAPLPKPTWKASPPSYDVRSTSARFTRTGLRLAEARHTPPAPRCYWVLPGRLLAGAYPGSADPKAHAARVEQLWKAGVRAFVSLMEPGEPSPIGEELAPYADVVRSLSHDDPHRARLLSFPVPDLSVPSRETMRAILDAVDLALEERRPAYVHCLGGVGRTGTVIGCWLRRHRLASRDDVLDVLGALRQPDVKRAGRPSPETAEQRAMVLSWEE